MPGGRIQSDVTESRDDGSSLRGRRLTNGILTGPALRCARTMPTSCTSLGSWTGTLTYSDHQLTPHRRRDPYPPGAAGRGWGGMENTYGRPSYELRMRIIDMPAENCLFLVANYYGPSVFLCILRTLLQIPIFILGTVL